MNVVEIGHRLECQCSLPLWYGSCAVHCRVSQARWPMSSLLSSSQPLCSSDASVSPCILRLILHCSCFGDLICGDFLPSWKLGISQPGLGDGDKERQVDGKRFLCVRGGFWQIWKMLKVNVARSQCSTGVGIIPQVKGLVPNKKGGYLRFQSQLKSSLPATFLTNWMEISEWHQLFQIW